MKHNGSEQPTVSTQTCPHCGGLLINDSAIDYKGGLKCDYYKCVSCGRPAQWGPIKQIYTPLLGSRF